MTQLEQAEALRERLRGMARTLGLLKDEETACCGMTLSQCQALVEIGRNSPLSLRELATGLLLDNSTMSRTVQQMVTNGWVTRESDEQDRRSVVLSLTDMGTCLYAQTEAEMAVQYERILSLIPQDKQAQVLESLHLLDQAMRTACC